MVDTCVKNSGNGFVKEVATREFMEEVTHVLKTASNQDVKHKVLYLVQTWGIAAKGNPSLSYITGTYSLLKAEGYAFPPVTEKIDSIFLETAVVSFLFHYLFLLIDLYLRHQNGLILMCVNDVEHLLL